MTHPNLSKELDWVQDEFLQLYLSYVENTESPRLMHLWSIVSAAGASMGRHAWLQTGYKKKYCNQYIMLTGTPGLKKSTALDIACDRLKEATNIKFAPKDTSGKRQGLISSMLNDVDVKEQGQWEEALSVESFLDTVETLKNVEFNSCLHEDRHCIYIHASELGSILGQNNLELTRFLGELWDGLDDYPYQLKNERHILKEPLISMGSATTPGDLATLLPPQAMSSGFMSRVIIVYAPKKYKDVPPSKFTLNENLKTEINNRLLWINKTLKGAITFKDQRTEKHFDTLYGRASSINDPRFIFYSERRHDHLIKLAIAITVLNSKTEISIEDLEQADLMLQFTEEYMPEGLGEYGLSPLAIMKQKIIEFMQYAKEPIGGQILWAHMQKDMKMIDFKNCIFDLLTAKKIAEVETSSGKAYVYRDPAFEALQLLAENPPTVLTPDSDVPRSNIFEFGNH